MSSTLMWGEGGLCKDKSNKGVFLKVTEQQGITFDWQGQ